MYRPRVGPSALERLRTVIDSGWIGLGPVTEQFENELSQVIGRAPVAVNSGTAALHLALAAGGVPQGTAVIVPANTFVSTAAVASQHRCRVLIADIERSTGNIDLSSVRQLLESEHDVGAIIGVHYAGIPCDIAGLAELAAEFGIVVVEDCAHALGSEWEGRSLGESPHIQAFSFHATKVLALGEGGCVTFPEADSANQARMLRRLGIDSSTRSWGNPYDIPELGFKYNMGDIAAAVGLAQLETLPEQLTVRRKIVARYRERLAESTVELVAERNALDLTAGFAIPVLVPQRDQVRCELYAAGVETEIYFKSLTYFPLGAGQDAPVAEQFGRDVLCLPIHSSLSIADVDTVCDRLLESVDLVTA